MSPLGKACHQYTLYRYVVIPVLFLKLHLTDPNYSLLSTVCCFLLYFPHIKLRVVSLQLFIRWRLPINRSDITTLTLLFLTSAHILLPPASCFVALALWSKAKTINQSNIYMCVCVCLWKQTEYRLIMNQQECSVKVRRDDVTVAARRWAVIAASESR